LGKSYLRNSGDSRAAAIEADIEEFKMSFGVSPANMGTTKEVTVEGPHVPIHPAPRIAVRVTMPTRR
jgi:hypothetical protein